MRIKFLLVFTFLFTQIFSQVLVLQQGLDGYSGCKDSFILHSNYGDDKILNFGDTDTLYTDVCYV